MVKTPNILLKMLKFRFSSFSYFDMSKPIRQSKKQAVEWLEMLSNLADTDSDGSDESLHDCSDTVETASSNSEENSSVFDDDSSVEAVVDDNSTDVISDINELIDVGMDPQIELGRGRAYLQGLSRAFHRGHGRSFRRGSGRGQNRGSISVAATVASDVYPPVEVITPLRNSKKPGSVPFVKWKKMEHGDKTQIRHNIRFQQRISGATNLAHSSINLNTLSAFEALFDEKIMKQIIQCTVEEARRSNDCEFEFDRIDLLAYIGVLYLRGVFAARTIDIEDMWSTEYGYPNVKLLMSRNRFALVKKYLRFDEKTHRARLVRDDRFILIRDVWTRLFNNSKLLFVPSKHLTVDEQLFPSKSRYPFIQYMSNKPDKFGIKFWVLTDLGKIAILSSCSITEITHRFI
jgi:hypothetical protein